MKMNILKAAVAVAFAMGTIGLAWAEGPPRLSPAELGALVKNSNGNSNAAIRMAGAAPAADGTGVGVTASRNGAALANALVSGWNTESCYTAVWYYDGTYHYVFALNSDGSYFYAYSTSSTQISLQGTFLNSCGTGATYHVNLSGSPGAFTVVEVETR